MTNQNPLVGEAANVHSGGVEDSSGNKMDQL